MSSEWYIEQQGQQYGPCSLADLFALRDQNRIAADARFHHDGQAYDWQALIRAWGDPRRSSGAGEADFTDDPAEPIVEILPDDTPPPLPNEAAEHRPRPKQPDYESLDRSIHEDLTSEQQRTARVPVERDAILMLGRRRAGKTVYLATLYAMHWKATDGLTMKALAGPTHKMLMGIADRMKQGQWPDATSGTRQLEFELDDHGRKRLLVAFDYAGENFSRAFVDEDQNSPDVRKLLNYLDRAMAVLLLVDPAVAVKGDTDEVADDDFGMVQAVERIRNWPGGDRVPVVLALTKADRTRGIIREAGGPREFVERHYPALVRTLKRVNIFTVSAVQQRADRGGHAVPAAESIPIHVDKPLRYCLDQIRAAEDQKHADAARQAAAAAEQAYADQLASESRSTNRRAAFIVAAILILGLCACTLIWILNTM